MSLISDMLKSPLPSKSHAMMEGACGTTTEKACGEACGTTTEKACGEACGNGETTEKACGEACGTTTEKACGEACGTTTEKCGGTVEEACGGNKSCKTESDDEDEDDDDDDEEKEKEGLDDDELSSLSDDELDELANSIISDEIDDIAGDDEEEMLTPDEERDADDMMGVVATTSLIQDDLNDDEKMSLLESMTDLQIAIDEGFMLESDIEALKKSLEPFMEAAFAQKTKVKFSLNDKKAQLYSIALNVCARAHNDPDYYKLQKIYRARRIMRAKLEKKYHSEAMKRMNIYIKKLKSSKSGVLSAIGKKISGK